MFLVYINYLAIMLCGLVAMVIGVIWYGPVFGKTWMKLVGLTGKRTMKNDMVKTYAAMFVAALVMAYVLAHFIWYAAPGSATVWIGVKTAIWAWLGLIAVSNLSRLLFVPTKNPVMLYIIDSGYYLITLVAMGYIIAYLG